MYRVDGFQSEFVPVREDRSRTIVSYGLTKGNKGHYTWNEVYIYKKQHPNLSVDDIKHAVLDDINKEVDAKILSGFEWTPTAADAAGTVAPIKVWLSEENQRNFSEAHRMGDVPTTFKLGEDENNQPVYHTFETFDELDDFYHKAYNYIKQCLAWGWAQKDALDLSIYETQSE